MLSVLDELAESPHQADLIDLPGDLLVPILKLLRRSLDEKTFEVTFGSDDLVPGYAINNDAADRKRETIAEESLQAKHVACELMRDLHHDEMCVVVESACLMVNEPELPGIFSKHVDPTCEDGALRIEHPPVRNWWVGKFHVEIDLGEG